MKSKEGSICEWGGVNGLGQSKGRVVDFFVCEILFSNSRQFTIFIRFKITQLKRACLGSLAPASALR